jgi:mannose-6-phosphate isomerase-like protein (cupin superfamily)
MPVTSSEAPSEATVAEFREKLPGLFETLELDNPGMHTSDTIDVVYVVSGQVWLELDDGAETRLQAGDCVVQNGTRHRWRNHSSEQCVMAIALIGAPRMTADTPAAQAAAVA